HVTGLLDINEHQEHGRSAARVEQIRDRRSARQLEQRAEQAGATPFGELQERVAWLHVTPAAERLHPRDELGALRQRAADQDVAGYPASPQRALEHPRPLDEESTDAGVALRGRDAPNVFHDASACTTDRVYRVCHTPRGTDNSTA